MNPVIALCLSILIGIGGQIGLKAGALNGDSGIRLFFQPYIIIALAGYGISSLLYIYALRDIPVSIAYPSIAVGYFAVALLAHLLWNEPFGPSQFLGLALVGTGILLMSKPISI